jgi:rhamnulokinase/L-fuculokinase
MVGGGIQNRLLCQWTADSCGSGVIAGPVEASAMGNIAMQLYSAGELDSLSAIRQVLADSQPLEIYEPKNPAKWNEAYLKFGKILCL